MSLRSKRVSFHFCLFLCPPPPHTHTLTIIHHTVRWFWGPKTDVLFANGKCACLFVCVFSRSKIDVYLAGCASFSCEKCRTENSVRLDILKLIQWDSISRLFWIGKVLKTHITAKKFSKPKKVEVQWLIVLSQLLCCIIALTSRYSTTIHVYVKTCGVNTEHNIGHDDSLRMYFHGPNPS